MKRLLFTILAVTIISCTSNLDKKIELTAYNNVIESIKKENTNYTNEDFLTASKELDKYSFKAMQSGNNSLDITYADLLNQAKDINLKKQKEQEAYTNSVKPLKDVFSIQILKGNFIDISKHSPQYPNGYAFEVKLTNTSSKKIKAFKGHVLLFNDKHEKLIKYSIEENFELEAGKSIEATDSTIIFEDDNLMELKALPFNKITQEWYPETIIFEDGSRLEALTKPLD